jgi:hypothetical protein
MPAFGRLLPDAVNSRNRSSAAGRYRLLLSNQSRTFSKTSIGAPCAYKKQIPAAQ